MGTKDYKVPVFYACQRCLRPIALCSSLFAGSEHDIAELELPVCDTNADKIQASNANAALYNEFVSPYRYRHFTLEGSKINKNQHTFANVKTNFFDFLSSNSEFDHPLCAECADTILELLTKQLDIKVNACDIQRSTLKGLAENDDFPELAELESTLSELHISGSSLLKELHTLKMEETELNTDLKKEETKLSQLDSQVSAYWREYAEHQGEFLQADDDKRSAEQQIAYATNQLDILKDTNVFNLTFHIWHWGHFGTINNFRLGRLQVIPVDWSEINSAWGQTALLLTSLARAIHLELKNYRIVPFGSHSYVEVLADKKELPLYSLGGFKFLWETKFDAAMIAFLDCCAQFQQYVEKRDVEFLLPYKIDKGRIIDPTTGNSYSIKIQFNSEEHWTKALKYLLTNLKWGMAWVSSNFTPLEEI